MDPVDIVESSEDDMEIDTSPIATEIIHNLKQQNIDSASEIYMKNLPRLSSHDREQLSKVFNHFYDDDGMIEYFFPYLHEDFGNTASASPDVDHDSGEKGDLSRYHANAANDAAKIELAKMIADKSFRHYKN
jgi:hypothetical protein